MQILVPLVLELTDMDYNANVVLVTIILELMTASNVTFNVNSAKIMRKNVIPVPKP